MKLFRLIYCCILIPIFGFSHYTIAEQPSAKDLHAKPNIVVFVADDMGWGDSATYGNALIQTPNMDKLAAEGVKFTQCYAACGVCSPSRSAILTGRTPYRNGVWRHLSGNHPAHLRESEITYPELLKEAGYETCHVGKWHLLSKQQFNTTGFPQPGDHGYDHWMYTQNNAIPSHKNPNNFIRNGKAVGETEGYSAQLVAAEAAYWLKDIHDPEKPFALSVWVHEPHKPIATDSRFQSLYKGHRNSKYMGNITQMDHALGMVMDALDEQGVSDNTFLFFTSDNGPEGKGEGRLAARLAVYAAANAATTKAAFACLESLAGRITSNPTRPATCQSSAVIFFPPCWTSLEFHYRPIAPLTVSAWCRLFLANRSNDLFHCFGEHTFHHQTIGSQCVSAIGKLSATI